MTQWPNFCEIKITPNQNFVEIYSLIEKKWDYDTPHPPCIDSYIRGFHKHTKLAILALLPTLYSQKFAVFFFLYTL